MGDTGGCTAMVYLMNFTGGGSKRLRCTIDRRTALFAYEPQDHTDKTDKSS